MRRGLLVLLAPLVFSAALAAQTQVGPVRGDQVLRGDQAIGGDRVVLSPKKPEAEIARVSPDEVVTRLLTFDRDRDGKVTQSELAERMQPLMARADKNRDGALDAREIRAIAAARPSAARQDPEEVGGRFSGSYGFADEDVSFSSLNHIDSVIEDLKLTADSRDQARSIARTYVDWIEADAEANLVREMALVLTPDELSALQQSLRARQRSIAMLRSQDGSNGQVVLKAAASILPQINQFKFSPSKRLVAQKAVDRYNARIKMSDDERVELVERMTSVLSAEERDNLRAALGRRPVVAKGGGTKVMAAGRLMGTTDTLDKFTGTIRTSDPGFGPGVNVRMPQGR